MSENSNSDFILSKFLLDVLFDFIIVVVLVVLIRFFLFAPFQVHGQSMCDSFNIFNGECYSGDGEYVLTSRLSTWDWWGWSPTEIQRGDVIIFQAPYTQEKEYYIKRVIGLPGETVKIEDGLVKIQSEGSDFVVLEEPYLNEENAANTHPFRSPSQVYTVPEVSYFVLGDNRTKSNDSRRCFQQIGCTPDTSSYLDFDRIEGEVKLVFFPLGHFRFVGHPDYSL